MKEITFTIFALLVLSACGGGAFQNENVPAPEFSKTSAILSNSSLEYEQLRAGMPENEARLALIEKLKVTDGVDSAGLSEDGFTVWFNDKNGVNMNLLTYSNPYTISPITLGKSIKSMNLSKSIGDISMPGAQWVHMYVPFFWEQTEACVDEGLFDVDISRCSSVEDFPYTDQSGIRLLKEYYTDPKTKSAFTAVTYLNELADVETIAAIFAMALTSESHIFIHTHGGVTWNKGNSFSFFLTGEKVTESSYAAKILDLINGRLSVVQYGGDSYFAITPSFVREKYSELTKTLGLAANFHVYLAACKSFHQSMINAFMDSGADSFTGFTGLASHDFVYDSLASIYSLLSTGVSIKDAVDSSSPKSDSLNFLTHVRTTTSSDKERYFYRMFFEFNEDSYETPLVQKLTVATNEDGGFSIGEVFTTLPESGEYVGAEKGTINLTLPEMSAGEYDITLNESTTISLLDNLSGKQWIASKECIDEYGCACSGKITINYADGVAGGVVEGEFKATLVDWSNIAFTKEISGTFTAVR